MKPQRAGAWGGPLRLCPVSHLSSHEVQFHLGKCGQSWGDGAFWTLVRRVGTGSVLCSADKGSWVSQGDSPMGIQRTLPPLVQTMAAPGGDEKVPVLSLPGVPQLLQQKVSSSLGCYRNNNASGTPHSLLSCLSSHMESRVAPLGKETTWVGTSGHLIPAL